MSDFWTKPRSLYDLADELAGRLDNSDTDDSEAGGVSGTGSSQNQPSDSSSPAAQSPATDSPMDEVTITGNRITDDPSTNDRIKTLHPLIRNDAAQFINDVKDRTGPQLRIPYPSAYRTTAEQDALYAQDRQHPVTNAPGGKSYHNYGLAFDVVGLNGKTPTTQIDYPAIAAIAREHGFEWGGNFPNFFDPSHFQRTYGYSTDQLQQMVQPDSPYPVIPGARQTGTP